MFGYLLFVLWATLSALGLQMAKFLVNFGRLLFVWWVTLNVINGKAVGIFSWYFASCSLQNIAAMLNSDNSGTNTGDLSAECNKSSTVAVLESISFPKIRTLAEMFIIFSTTTTTKPVKNRLFNDQYSASVWSMSAISFQFYWISNKSKKKYCVAKKHVGNGEDHDWFCC